MEATPGTLNSLIQKAESYFTYSVKLLKLKPSKASITLMSAVVFKLLMIVLISILFNIYSMGAGLWMGEMLGKTHYGFIAVSVLYLLSILVLHLFFQKWIKKIISNSLLSNI